MFNLINTILWKLFKKTIWFNATHKAHRPYYETNWATTHDIIRYLRKPGYTIKLWIN